MAAGFVVRSLQTHGQGMRVARASPAAKTPAPYNMNLFLHGPDVPAGATRSMELDLTGSRLRINERWFEPSAATYKMWPRLSGLLRF